MDFDCIFFNIECIFLFCVQAECSSQFIRQLKVYSKQMLQIMRNSRFFLMKSMHSCILHIITQFKPKEHGYLCAQNIRMGNFQHEK